MTELIATYGYAAVFVGCFLEGETILVLGGFAAHRGYLDIWLVVMVAFVGTSVGDQLYFFLGRRWGNRILARRPGWQVPAGRARRLLERYDVLFILSFRFLYGLRTMSPFAIGMSGFPTRRFLALNLIAGAVWAVAVAWAGYAFGHGLALAIDRFARYEKHAFVAIAIAGALLWGVHHLRQRRQRAAPPSEGKAVRPPRE